MKISLPFRIALFFLILCAAAFTPWWLPAGISLAAALTIRRYGEIVLVGIMLDALYATSVFSFPHTMLFTISAIILLGIIEYVRPKIFTVQ
jgi:hypothetical protein